MPVKGMTVPAGGRCMANASTEGRASTPGDGFEGRNAPRKASDTQGFVRIPGYRLNLVCRIANISSTGARLEFIDANAHHLPDRVVVVFAGDHTEIDAEIRWRNGRECGVHFTSQFRRTQSKPRSG